MNVTTELGAKQNPNDPFTHNSFAEYEARKRHINNSQSLWTVRDDYIACPEERFLEEFNTPYLTQVIEGGCGGPLEMSVPPKGLLNFIDDMVKKFSVGHTELVAERDVIYTVFRFLDYSEPYYLLADAPVQLSSGRQLVDTFREKDTGSVFPPDQIEVFEVKNGYRFDQFELCKQMFAHPATAAVLKGEYVKHPVRGDRLTRSDLIQKLGRILWGTTDFLDVWVEEWMFTHYENVQYDHPNLPDDVIRSLDSYKERDRNFWYTVATATLVWLKSPYSLQFLIDHIPIYQALLRWNHDSSNKWHGLNGEPELIPGSAGVAVVAGWDILNGNHLTIERGVAAGSCVVCKQSLHCTKLINSWATVDPICDCGVPLPIEIGSVDGGHMHVVTEHRKTECKAYRDRHPGYPRLDYVCQHCLFSRMQRIPPEIKCGRATCPNLKCVHHMGQQAHIRALTKNRTMMLTHKEAQ